MRRQSWIRNWFGQTVVVGAVLLLLPIGVCVFAGHHAQDGNHGVSPELCAGVTAVPTNLGLLSRPSMNWWPVSIASVSFSPVSPDLLDRPPETASLV